jgi:TolB protein
MEVPPPEPGPPLEDRPVSEFDAPLEPVVPPRRRFISAVAIILVVVAVLTGFAGVGLFWLPHGQPAPVAPSPTPTTPLVAASSGPSSAGRLAVIGHDGALVIMDGTGALQSRFDVPRALVSFPAWSPDGTQIAALVNGPEVSAVQVFPATPGAITEPVTVYKDMDEPPFYLSWALDGRSVAFLTTEPNGIALRRAPADASAAATRLRDGSPMYWIDLGSGRLLVHSGSGADAFLGEIDPDGKPLDPGFAASDLFRAPAVSGDGAYRAYAGTDSNGVDAVVVETRDGSGRHAVPILGPAAVAFAPSGATVAFIARASADVPRTQLPVGPLRVLDAASGAVRTLVSGAVLAFFWSPDGRTIAVLRIAGPNDSVAQAGIRLASTGDLALAGVALDLVFVDAEDGSVVARQAVRVTDLYATQVLPFFDQYASSHRIWSSDSSAIALPVISADGLGEIDIIATDGSAPRRLATGDVAFWSP